MTGGTMSTTGAVTQREPALLGQTVVVIGGSAGIGLETARRARAEGADVIVTGRNPERLEQAARELGARSSAAFDAADPDRLARFFDDLPTPIDHVMVTAGRPYYAPLAEIDFDQARRSFDDHLWLARPDRGCVDVSTVTAIASGNDAASFSAVAASIRRRRASRLRPRSAVPSPLPGPTPHR
jgi:NAD(P)-dependent dehydrogenase (short-subunit alcohol dehydrogenase family)